MRALDFSADAATEAAVPDDQLTRLAELVRQQRDAEAVLEQLAAEMKTHADVVRRVSEFDIPALLDETGLSELRLSDGTRVSIKEDLRVSTTGKHKNAIHAWLEAQGHGDLIKSEVSARFGKGEDESARAALLGLQAANPDATLKRSVAPQSFAALVRELRDAGQDVPLDELGVFVQRRAELRS